MFNTTQLNTLTLNFLEDGSFETRSVVEAESTTDFVAFSATSSICKTASTLSTDEDFSTLSTLASSSITAAAVSAASSTASINISVSEHSDAVQCSVSTTCVAASTVSTEIDFNTSSVLASSCVHSDLSTAAFSTVSSDALDDSFYTDFDCSGTSTCFTASTVSILADNASFATSSTCVAGSTTTGNVASDFGTVSTLVGGSTTTTAVTALFASTSLLGAISSIPGDSSTVWNINSETGSAWTYTNYPFNSVCDLNGMILAAGSGGIYVVDQTTDAGSDVIAEAKSGLIDFNSQALKNILSVDVLGQFASAPVIKVSETGTGALREWHYKSAYPVDSAYKEHVIKTGRGLRSRYYGIAVQAMGAATVERINPQIVQLKTRH